jgi:hypothetical protein
MSSEENMKILSKILDGIANNNLSEVMEALGFDVSKDTEKSKEWTLK